MEKRGKGYKTQVFYNAIQKYGWENIKHEIIATNLTYEDAIKIEIDLIKKYKTREYDFGYNCTNGGDGVNGLILKETTKQKMREQRQGINARGFGSFPNEETKKKMSKSGQNKIFSKETREKMANEKNKIVYQYDLNGNFIDKYESASIASKVTNTNVGNLCACCRKIVKTAGGYFWSYEEINDKKLICDYINYNIELPIIKSRNEKSVVQYDLDGNEINRFNSLKEASLLINIPSQEISQSCKNPNKVTRYFKWRFADETDSSGNGE